MAGATNQKEAAVDKDEVSLQRKKSCDTTEMMGFLFSDDSQEKSGEEMAEKPAVANNNEDNTPAASASGIVQKTVVETGNDVVSATPDVTPDVVTATPSPNVLSAKKSDAGTGAATRRVQHARGMYAGSSRDITNGRRVSSNRNRVATNPARVRHGTRDIPGRDPTGFFTVHVRGLSRVTLVIIPRGVTIG